MQNTPPKKEEGNKNKTFGRETTQKFFLKGNISLVKKEVIEKNK